MTRSIVTKAAPQTDPQLLALHVAALDSDARAILDLSLRYGFSDERLAAMLQLSVDDVAVRRELALSELARRAGLDQEVDRARLEEALRAVPHETWIGRELREPAPEPEPAAPAPPPPDQRAIEATERPGSGHLRRWIAGLVALACVAAVTVLIVSGDDDDARSGAPVEAAPPSQPGGGSGTAGESQAGGPLGAGRKVTMKAVAGAAPSTATIRLARAGPPPQLALRFHTKADHGGIYEVWLYDTVIDARPLAKIPHKGGTARFELPDSAGDYRYIDISAERRGGFPGHSGRSVERIGVRAAIAGLGLGGG